METKVNYTAVGAFVIVLFTALILSIIWLSAGFSNEKYTMYEVFMKEAVTGLSLEAPVEYNGVNVGAVTSIRIDKKNPHFVELLLKIKSDTPITKGTSARLNVRTLSGVAFILLQDKGHDMTPLVAEGANPYPVISTEPSLFLRLDTALTQLIDNFKKLTMSVESLLSDQNLQAARQLLQSSQKTMQLIETQTIPQTNEAAKSIGVLVEDLSEMTDEIQLNPAMLIRGKEPGTLGPGEQ